MALSCRITASWLAHSPAISSLRPSRHHATESSNHRISVRAQQGTNEVEDAPSTSSASKKSTSGVGFGAKQVRKAKSKPSGPEAIQSEEDASDTRALPGVKSSARRRKAPQQPLVTNEVDELQGNVEKAVVLSLGTLFAAIIVLGLVMASSVFIPKGQDQWIVDYIYPNYSKLLLVFLAGSSLYGAVKFIGGGGVGGAK